MILRNFIHTLKSHKVASVLNILGLAIAFTSFYVMASQIWYSLTYNKSIENSDRIYLVSPDWNRRSEDGVPEWSENCPQPATREAVAASPDAELYTWFLVYDNPKYVWESNGDGNYIKHNIGCYIMSTDGIEMFGFKEVDGDLSRMSEPNTIIISRSAAEKMNCRTGDVIWFNGGKYYSDYDSKTMMTVAGIFEDFPRNTFLYDHHIFYDDKCIMGQENNNWNYSAFVRLKKDADPDGFARIWERQYATWYLGMVEVWKKEFGEDDYEEGDEKLPVRLISLDEMYYDSTFRSMYFETASVKTTATLIGISLLIIIIAFINFFNFYMALVPVRIRSVNINKVLGATQRRIRTRLIAEAVVLNLLAFCISICLILILKQKLGYPYLTCSLAIKDNIVPLVFIGTTMMLIAGISAAFPAIYTTRVNTSMAVKTGFAQSRAGSILRSILVGLQFTVSMTLIIITSVFFIQYRYMTNYDLGFDKDNMLTFSCRELRLQNETVIERLEQHPDIMAVTASNNDIFTENNIWGREIDGKQVHIYSYPVRWNFLEVMGIPVVEGEGFSGDASAGNQIVFTRSSMPVIKPGCTDGLFDEEYEIKGTIEDVRLTSLSNNDVLIGLYTHPRFALSTFYIRLRPQADIISVQKHIRKIVKELKPDADEPRISLLDENMKVLYSDIRKQTTTIGIFALISILISLMGVFSIVMFETRHKESEISVRKVYGATVEDIIKMFNRRYIVIVAVCFCIAAPVAYIITARWLEQFAHRIPVPLWVFPAALAAILAITVTVVSLRSLRAARTNPAEALKKE